MSSKKTALPLLLCAALLVGLLALPASAASGALPFTDVSSEDWYYEGVDFCCRECLMNGTGGTSFSPDMSLSRAMLATMLHRLDSAPAVTSTEKFTDVQAGSWYDAAVSWAAAKDILQGGGDGTVSPEAPLTMEQMGLMVDRYLKDKGFDSSLEKLMEDSGAPDAQDADEVSRGYAAAALAELSRYVRVEKAKLVDPADVPFDFAESIAKEKKNTPLVPQAADVPLSIQDEKGASGSVLTASVQEDKPNDLYLNAYVAGNQITVTSKDPIESAESSESGKLTVEKDSFTFTPAAIQASKPTDEVITVTMADKDKTVYKIHTVHEQLPVMEITASEVADKNAGIYDFALDKFLLRVNTNGELVYYRNVNCAGEGMVENFACQPTKDGKFFTYFVELRVEFRNTNGGYSSGMYAVMDENYADVEQLTLLPNTKENNTHGEGYLDQHECVVLGKGHYLNLSYTPLKVDNLPDSAPGVDGSTTGYVWAGIFQEVKDGKLVAEINTADYPLLYESAVEKRDYAHSTDQGVDVELNQGGTVHSLAEGFMDYVHPNSLDYSLNADGSVNKLLVSMRDQCAVYQFDLKTGAIDWILGGKDSTLTGYNDYSTARKDESGNRFNALTYGQHFARYMDRAEDGTVGDPTLISVFDNQTGDAPFRIVPPAPVMAPNLTRTFTVKVDAKAGTATVDNVVNGVDLNKLSKGYHIASHCGSVQYDDETSVTIGWGLHGVVDNIGPQAPKGTITDEGFDDLRQGSRPVFTEYDMTEGKITFELYATRNTNLQSHEPFFSYRTYKTAG